MLGVEHLRAPLLVWPACAPHMRLGGETISPAAVLRSAGIHIPSDCDVLGLGQMTFSTHSPGDCLTLCQASDPSLPFFFVVGMAQFGPGKVEIISVFPDPYWQLVEVCTVLPSQLLPLASLCTREKLERGPRLAHGPGSSSAFIITVTFIAFRLLPKPQSPHEMKRWERRALMALFAPR